MQLETLVTAAQHARTPAERRAALDTLAAEFSGQAERWAYAVLGDTAAAQDAAQEALITAFEALDTLREPAAFAGWLKRIVIRQCSRITRKRDYDSAALDEDSVLSADEDPAEAAETRDLSRRLYRAIDRLPDAEREVTELFYLGDLSQQEIADRLVLPLTTVKKRLQYARERLRETLISASMPVPLEAHALDEVIHWLLTIPIGSIEPFVLA